MASKILNRLGFMKGANRTCRPSQHSNILLQQAKSSNSIAGCQRHFFSEERNKKVRASYYANLLDYMEERGELEVMSSIFLSVAIEVIEKDSKKPPVIESALSIGQRILELESVIAPELKNVRSALDEIEGLKSRWRYVGHFTEAKWRQILEKKDNQHVKRLLELMDAARVNPIDFPHTLGAFSLIPMKSNERVRKLSEFTPEDVEYCCRRIFYVEKGAELESAVKCITHVLMRF